MLRVVAPAANEVSVDGVKIRQTVEAVDGMVIVKPKGRLTQLTLAQKLKRFDPALHAAELLADRPVGRERV